MDEWLDSQGLYRKNTALDGTCLFRAVAEQLFQNHSPHSHILLREQCVDFMRKNKHIFEDRMVSGPYDEYLDNLSDEKQWAGQLELEAISLIYEVDFLLFKSIDLEPISATDNGFDKKLMLCFTPDNFYDAVYPKSYIDDSGFCQSIVYGVLYRGVFKLDDLDYAVEKMLHDKGARAQREKYLNSQTQCRDENAFDFYLEETDGPFNMRELLDMGAILFPYKVAKALDPDIYRNIEFDNWVDTLRVPRKNSFWFGNGGPLRVGVKCLLKLDDDKCYSAHIQEMSPDCGPVLVFVEELGEKMSVALDTLEPLPRSSLKPEWTFSHKHQIINKLNGARKGEQSVAVKVKTGAKPGGKGKKARGSLSPIKVGGYERSLSMKSDCSTPTERSASADHKVTVAEPDSTSSTPEGLGTPPVVLTPCSWPAKQPPAQVVKPVNVMVCKSVRQDFSDLPLSDLETTRFFFNLGIDYFRMGYLVWPSSGTAAPASAPPLPEDKPAESCRPAKGSEEGCGRARGHKSSGKAPRFMKLEQIEARERGYGRHEECYDEVSSTVMTVPPPPPPPLPPMAPMCTYPHTYPPMVPCVAEPPRPLYRSYAEMPMAVPVSEYPGAYPVEPVAHYMEPGTAVCDPAYTMPYAVYPHPTYYYSN